MAIIETRYATKNPCYNINRTINVKGLMLHSVGCSQPSAEVFYRLWNQTSCDNVCVHGVIDNDKTIICLPCMENTKTSRPGVAHRGWHAGTGTTGYSANNSHIGFEMTEPACIKYTCGATFTCSDRDAAVNFMEKNFANAVDLFARLCIFHKLDPLADGVIISHKEGHAKGVASNHGDPDHIINQLEMNYSMDQFRQDVNTRVTELTSNGYSQENIGCNTMINVEEDDIMTEEKFAEMLRAYRNTLRDNDASNYSEAARKWAIQHGIIQGTDTKLPNGELNYMWEDLMTREQMITVLYRFAKLMIKE